MAENICLGQNETLFVPFKLENAYAVHMSLKEIRKWKDNIQRTRSLSCVEFDLMYVAGNNRIQITEREKIAVVLAIVTGFGLPVVIILLIRAYRHGRWVQLEDFKEASLHKKCFVQQVEEIKIQNWNILCNVPCLFYIRFRSQVVYAMISGTECTKLCHVSGVTSHMLWPLCGMSFEQCKHHGSLSVMGGGGGGGEW